MAATSQQRKITTYGKACRRPLIKARFAVDAKSQWDQGWDLDDVHDKDATTNASSDSALSSLPNLHERQIETLVSSGRSSSYEFPSSDEERFKSQDSQARAVMRKKRKLTPDAAKDEKVPPYDHKSLRRNHTEYIPIEERYTVAKQIKKKALPVLREDSEPARSTGQVRFKHRLPVVGRANKRQQIDSTRKKRPAVANLTSSATKHVPNDPILPSRPKLRNKSHSDAPHNGPQFPAGQSHPPQSPSELPTTPPRHTSTLKKKETTTPRQRDLWNRLLVDESHSTSPSKLNPPELQIAKYPPESHLSRRSEKVQKKWYKNRPERLVDTLNQREASRSPPGNESSDDSIITASDNDSMSTSEKSMSSTVNESLSLQPSLSTTQQGQNASVSGGHSTTQVGSKCQSAGPKVTYAQQRSFLTHRPREYEGLHEVKPVAATVCSQYDLDNGIKALAHDSETEIDHGYDVEEIQDLQSGAMRSIHELRQAGGNARLVGELETILEELDDAQEKPSIRRSALMGLASKFEEASNCRIFVDRGLESRLLLHIDVKDDLIIKSLILAVLLRLNVHCSSATLIPQMREGDVMDFLTELLRSKENLTHSARKRGFNLSKLAQEEYVALCGSLLESDIWRTGKPAFLSCQVLSLQCLEYLVRRQREANMRAEILSIEHILSLFETSVPELSSMSQLGTDSQVCLHLALSILESCSVGGGSDSQAVWPQAVIDRLIGVLPGLHYLSSTDKESLEILVLRLYLNLTNKIPSLCEAFAKSSVIHKIFDIVLSYFSGSRTQSMKDQQLLLDRTILSLGCLINFAEVSDAVRDLMLLQRNGQPCILDALLGLFLANNCRTAEVK